MPMKKICFDYEQRFAVTHKKTTNLRFIDKVTHFFYSEEKTEIFWSQLYCYSVNFFSQKTNIFKVIYHKVYKF